MWLREIIFTGLFLLLSVLSVAQSDSASAEEITSPNVFKPTIGIGAGMFTFYGDIGNSTKHSNPIISRIGYDLRITQPLTSYLEMSFYVLNGKLGANERSLERNLNFESQVTIGGFLLSYNFDQILKKDRLLSPYIAAGAESFEFLSKTDRLDAYGNTYNYWSDGSIRNIAEDAPDAEKAIRIYRDYTYESDIREINADGFGKYPERSWAFPVGVGANLHLSEKVNFRIGTAMHFTMTDFVDGVTAESVGNRKGDAANDKFLFTSFNFSYNLVTGRPDEEKLKKEHFKDVDFLAMTKTDSDGDGIMDFYDECAGTPGGAVVDEKGCPEDGDADGVPDILDLELNSADTAVVDSVGVTIPDSVLERRYLAYMDSTGIFAKTTKVLHAAEKRKKKKKISYAVQIGEYKEGIPTDLVDMFLSIPDVETVEENGVTTFIVGDYDNLPDAIKRMVKLSEEGVPNAIVVTKDDMKEVNASDVKALMDNMNTESEDVKTGIVYRVQVGAFRGKLSKNIFSDIPSVVSLTSDDGLTRYYSGSFDNYQEAAKRKVDIVMQGFDDAFVVALEGGNRLPLTEAGATPSKGREAEVDNIDNSSTPSGVNKDKISFSIQVGAFQQKIPTEILEKFMALGDVKQKRGEDGTTRYVIGSFSSYGKANAYKEKLVSQGIDDAFVVGEFDGRVITAKEALELLKD